MTQTLDEIINITNVLLLIIQICWAITIKPG